MSDADRELVADYLLSIGLHLDIKAKGKRDPQQKWFSASQVDAFVLGTDHYAKSKSPGLVKNILAICEIIFDKNTVADYLADTEEEPPPPKKPKTSRKDRLTAQPGAKPTATAAAASSNHLSVSSLAGFESAPDDAILVYIQQKYGNRAGVVIQILTAWEAYGQLFTEWRAEWTADSDEYRAKRALRLARAGRDFQAALISLSNYKQKSWYTHAIVWITWQQVFMFGNTWPLSTI